jgi:glutamate dehydrogenase
MITEDPQRRSLRLKDALEELGRIAAPEDRPLLEQFAPVVLAEMPDRIVLGLSPSALARRVADHFRFVAREMPPAVQLYKGLPGIHVSASNPQPAEAAPSAGIPAETTVVQTHTMDAPFIFESLKNYFRKAGLRVFSAIHPIITVRRQWERIVWFGGPHDDGAKECYCHFQIERIDSKERLRHVEHQIYSVLKCVFAAVEDFGEMRRVIRDLGPRLSSRRGVPEDVTSARAFLDWLLENNYIFQGTVQYRIGRDGQPDRVQESAEGAFNDPTLLPVVFPGFMEEAEEQIIPSQDDDRIIHIDYCHNASAIYHLEPIDKIVVREWDPSGRLAGATVVLGRFAMGAFTQKAAEIPLLKEKQDWLLANSGALSNSYAYREVRALFNRFPKRELFYARATSLKEIFDRITFMTGDDEVAALVRSGKGYEALYLAFSRVRYSYKVEDDLARAFSEAFGPLSFSTSTDCGAVNLLLFYFDSSKLEHPVEAEEARRLVSPLITTWEDRVAAQLEGAYGEREGRRLFNRYVRSESRSGLYREATPPEEVPGDIKYLEALEGRLEVGISPRTPETALVRLYTVKDLGLTDTLRTLHNLGLTVTDELRVPLLLPEGRRGLLYRVGIEASPDLVAALLAGEERFAETLRALDEERATDDPLNGLVLQAGMSWREVELLRTLRNHLLQIRPHYNVETVNGVLLRNSTAAALLFRAFAAQFDPNLSGDRSAAVAAANSELTKGLEAVGSLVEDEVLRAFDNLVRSSLRTNYFQRPVRPVLSVKVDSRKVEGMPSPRPMCEIYVHSRLLEGIHLRGGRVARGGIRWSDRHDDFRTEVLGLMKTQMLKNSIIVPVGSKGGFVLKGTVPPRPALDAYLVDRYREFISGLLDVTDNIVDGTVLHPPEVVRADGDDPYLVVAADKGTAHLSDTANSVSAQYGFWLGDAFASGGSQGYDHKKVGITARGAWECVKHHFRNLGTDVQKEPFTMAGIGDMAGDVFGNGALQSRATKLVAAFNHVHIFIDPDPDPERSFVERERLFRLPRSSWRDYDASLISRGGGVFDRSAKAIPISPEMRALLEIEAPSASGEEVIRRILTAGVDLLYNGGIGTYVKSSGETDAEVGDRANDRVRVNAGAVRARVVAEGGNLGFTQKGRLEYWRQGGHINTDAVDNSGGVDMSDHEVNIKILMDILVKKGVVRREERNHILAEMTEEVAGLVLADNDAQALALSLDAIRSARRYEEFVAFLDDMLGAGALHPGDDAVPGREELLSSPEKPRGLPRPLLAVVLGRAKMWAFDMVLETDFPDTAAGEGFLTSYFPARLQVFEPHFSSHTLRREIVATGAVNHVINCAGITFLFRVEAVAKAGIGRVMGAYIEAEAAAGGRGLRKAILGSQLGAAEAQKALVDLEDALESTTLASLAGKDAPKGVDALRKRLGL